MILFGSSASSKEEKREKVARERAMSFAKGEIKLMMDARIDRESLSGERLLLVFLVHQALGRSVQLKTITRPI
jgi:hypothetical protein